MYKVKGRAYIRSQLRNRSYCASDRKGIEIVYVKNSQTNKRSKSNSGLLERNFKSLSLIAAQKVIFKHFQCRYTLQYTIGIRNLYYSKINKRKI